MNVANPADRAPTSSSQKPAVIAGFLGWTLDAFDYFLVVYCLTAIAKDFGRSDAEMALAITVTLALRPVGTLIFGLRADRYGRRRPLMPNLIFFSASRWLRPLRRVTVHSLYFARFAESAWAVFGVWAARSLRRKLRRVCAGGVWLPAGRLCTGKPSGCSLFLFSLPAMGMAPPVLVGGMPALLAIYVRFQVTESEVWQKTKSSRWSEQWRAIISIAGIGAIIGGIAGGYYSDLGGAGRS